MIVTQANKKHDANRLHDALNAANLHPRVMVYDDRTELIFENPTGETNGMDKHSR